MTGKRRTKYSLHPFPNLRLVDTQIEWIPLTSTLVDKFGRKCNSMTRSPNSLAMSQNVILSCGLLASGPILELESFESDA